MIPLLLFALVVAAMFLLQPITPVLGTECEIASDALHARPASASGMSALVESQVRRLTMPIAFRNPDGIERTMISRCIAFLAGLHGGWVEARTA